MKNIEIIANEIQTAKEKYGHFNSTHEVYGVLIEEVQEFFQEVQIKNSDQSIFKSHEINEDMQTKKKNMIHELNQIAAIALRAADELKNNEIKWV